MNPWNLLCVFGVHRVIVRTRLNPRFGFWFGTCIRCGEETWGTR